MTKWRILAAAPLLFGIGCFHQVVQTGRAPSETVVEKGFVATWLWGLVPAQELDVRQQCPSGIATVETEQSFANGFVSVLTLGIYTPQHVRITCATRAAMLRSGSKAVVARAGASSAELQTVLNQAAQVSEESSSPVFVQF